MDVTLLDSSSIRWASELERVGLLLGAGSNPTVFPYHFLYVTLSKIGGKLAIFRRGGRSCGVAFLFPRQLRRARPVYTLRYHSTQEEGVDPAEVVACCKAALPEGEFVFYQPQGVQLYERTHLPFGVVDIGRPDEREAAESRVIQQQVWGAPQEFLYPADIHAVDFGAGTSLVARVDGRTAGFLFGFYAFSGVPLPSDWSERFNGAFRIESQALGVLPEYRGLRVANLLKRQQAALAWQQGVGIVTWTADPLQYPNAALNFGLLKALSCHFFPDLYPFRNELNRIHASRFVLTWLVGSRRVCERALLGEHAEVLDLGARPRIPRVNDGCRQATWDLSDEVIAIEIPNNWTQLQMDDLQEAQAWRALTDRIFSHYIGREPGCYTVTGVGTHGERRYLVAEQSGEPLWRRLGRV